MITHKSQAHLQFARANAKAKNCKRACLPANAFFADPKKENWNYSNVKRRKNTREN